MPDGAELDGLAVRRPDGSSTFGNGGNWKPIAGDWNGDGYATQGVVHS
ncbi:hypothetical protein ACFQ8S_37095 [Streptomyces virginiae]